jgi:hypothetical protein
MKANAARRGHSLASLLMRTPYSILEGPTASQNYGPVLESPKNRIVKRAIRNVHEFTLSMSMAYLFRNRLHLFALPMTLPASMMLKTGGMNEALRMTTSSLPSGSAITKSGLLNGFPRRRTEGLLYAETGRPSITPEKLLRAMLLQVFKCSTPCAANGC